MLARLAPGDPLQSFYGDAVDTMTQEQLDAARARLGLDQSIAVQYIRWICNALHGDFGISLKYKMPAQQVISPLIVMVASPLWYYAYMIRNKLLDELRKDYVLLAKGKGLTRSQIVWKHCLRNVAPTIVSIMAISVPHITGGTVVVESVFAYPGIGNLAVESAKYHDYNLLMLSVLITGALVFFSSFVAQLVNEQIDPRMKEVGTIQW